MLNVACEDPGRLIEDVQCLMNSECERRDLVNMLNVACEDPGRLIEDVQCLMNSECERRDLVNMLNVACEDPGRLIEDVQCLMNSEGAQMDQLCLYHLLHMQMDFFEDENSANKISVQGSEVFGWFIHYYVCQIACGMIENDRCSVQAVREFFDRATVQFGLV